MAANSASRCLPMISTTYLGKEECLGRIGLGGQQANNAGTPSGLIAPVAIRMFGAETLRRLQSRRCS
jgi:hypothetical protein